MEGHVQLCKYLISWKAMYIFVSSMKIKGSWKKCTASPVDEVLDKSLRWYQCSVWLMFILVIWSRLCHIIIWNVSNKKMSNIVIFFMRTLGETIFIYLFFFALAWRMVPRNKMVCPSICCETKLHSYPEWSLALIYISPP